MSYFVFEDRTGNLCSRYDLNIVKFVYPHWDFSQSPEILLDLVISEIQNLKHQNHLFQKSMLRDNETKNFLVYQTSDIMLQLKRLKKFLEDGISKQFKLVID
jgi:hypothetical protein